MRKCSKKLLAVLTAAAMACGLAACGGDSKESSSGAPAGESRAEEGGKEEEGSDAAEGSGEGEAESGGSGEASAAGRISQEEITLEVTGPQPSGLEDWTKLAVIEEYANRLGIRLNCNFYQTDWETQRTLMVADDKVPDLVINAGIGIGDMNKWGEEGYFLNLKDYIHLMPNMQKTFEEYPGLEAFVTASDGSIYGLARVSVDLTDRLSRTYINRKWLENLNLEVPSTIDELYDVLKAFKEQDANGNGDPNDEVPMLYQASYYAVENVLLNAYGIRMGGVGSPGYLLEAEEDGKVYLVNTTDAYREFLRFMHRLYAEGLMEQQAYTITSDEITSKQQGDVYGFFGCGSAPFVMANRDISYDAEWVGLAGLTSSLHSEKTAPLATPVGSSITIAVGADTEHPEEVVKFLDYFYSEEGKLAATRGYEGVTFDYVHDDELDFDNPQMRCPEGYASDEEYRYKGAVINTGLNLVEENAVRAALFEVPMDTLLRDNVVKTYGWAALTAYANRQEGISFVDMFPRIAYTTEEADARLALYNDINKYLETTKAQFITGELDLDADWDNYVGTLDQMGLADLLAIEQGAYDRYLSVVQ